MPIELYSANDVIQAEENHLKQRREKLFGAASAAEFEDTKFGIALSGGGIRSATICLGLLKTLNYFKIPEKADYMSSVSGGGYTHSYVQSTVKEQGSFEALFQQDHIDYLRSQGDYLIPGMGWRKIGNRFMLFVGFLVSMLMSWVSLGILGYLIYSLYLVFTNFVPLDLNWYHTYFPLLQWYGGITLVVVVLMHFFANLIRNYELNISKYFNQLETFLVTLFLLVVAILFLSSIRFNAVRSDQWSEIGRYALILLGMVIFGFFTNPNALSFHRYYRKQLADAFLHFSGSYKNALLKNLSLLDTSRQADYLAPYPLVNTCLNLQSYNDKNFKGAKTSDYFLLSPLFCGAKITKYVKTNEVGDYSGMTLPAAVTISAAAVNPGMGIYSNKILGLFTTLFNARLGVWLRNPISAQKPKGIVWWPLYFLYELFSKIGTDNNMVNISDGGHIENLAVYELLRRKCRLILAVDGGADPFFTFADLQNLTIRARNELGFELRFRDGQSPEEIISPRPSYGYSRKRFAIADIYQVWEDLGEDAKGKKIIENYQNKRIGTFVYIKSSVVAPKGKPSLSPDDGLKYDTYKYKIYHPSFPHESTADQFFDPVQWEAYFQLGQYIGADLLDIPNLEAYTEKGEKGHSISVDDLIKYFDENCPLFVEKKVAEVEDAGARGGIEMVEVPASYETPKEEEVKYEM
jgi:hypothetical protein